MCNFIFFLEFIFRKKKPKIGKKNQNKKLIERIIFFKPHLFQIRGSERFLGYMCILRQPNVKPFSIIKAK